MGGDHLWDAIGAVAELIGAIGVIASLIYLANQIRQNSQSVKAESVRELLSQSSDLFLGTATSPELITAIVKRLPENQVMTEDQHRLNMLAAAMFSNFENGYYQFRSGSLPAEIHTSYERRIVSILNANWAREYWEGASIRYSYSFRNFVDDLARKADAIEKVER